MEEKHLEFMRCALRLANNALHNQEVPVACVFVYRDQVVAHGMNSTNDALSGVKHAEFKGIDTILCKLEGQSDEHRREVFGETDLYVTVEPCVMCASALKLMGIRQVYFGCGNERFGGNGSCLSINNDSTLPENRYRAVPGILRKEAIVLLREFYTRENGRAPVPRSKKNRNLNRQEFPPLNWSDYITRQEFIEVFGEEKTWEFDQQLDIYQEINDTILDPANTDISDITGWCDEPLPGLNKRRKSNNVNA